MKQLDKTEIQKHILSMMKEVHKFCVDHDIQYSLEGGSLIGAIRHKGFIPWDDDIDIMMTRPNFEKFCKCFNLENFDLRSPGQDGYYLRFARVFDKKKTIVKEHEMPFADHETGIWIDIFPIDCALGDEKECTVFIDNCEKLQLNALEYRALIYSKANILGNDTIKGRIHYFLAYLKHKLWLYFNKSGSDDIVNKIRHERETLNSLWRDDADFCMGVCFAHNKYSNRYSKKWFDEYIDTPFEDTNLRVLKCYDEYLTMVFGNYMIIPPKEKQVVHNFYKVYWK